MNKEFVSKFSFSMVGLFFVLLSYSYGVITVQYKVFPFNEIRAVKNFISQSESRFSPKYLHRKSFFEVHGVKSDIVMIGDSITEGAEWDEIFKNSSIVNRGIGGDTAKGILNRIDSIISTGAKKSFIMVGINDLNKGVSVDDVYSSYKFIIAELKRANITPYIQSTIYAGEKLSNLNSSISSLNVKLEKLAKKEGLIYIDLNEELSPDGLLKNRFTKDDVHLNGQGYWVWKKLIGQYIEPKA
jgi:lysophospholipase L1-like esterase